MPAAAEESPLVLYEKTERVASIALNKPEKLNTLDEKTFKAIEMRAKINGYGKLLRML